MLEKMFGHPVGPVFYRWISFNLLLAIIPVGLAYVIRTLAAAARASRSLGLKLLLVIVILVWIAFLPNTCYLLTEWRHFLDSVVSTDFLSGSSHPRLGITAQAVFFALYSGAGMLCFTLAIRPVERACRDAGIAFPALAWILFLLISLGVYLGLILRWNSWDLVLHPQRIFVSIARIEYNQPLIVAIIVFGALLWLLYEGLDLWMDGIAQRFAERGLKRASNPGRASRNSNARRNG